MVDGFFRGRFGNRFWDQYPGTAGEAGVGPEGSLMERQAPPILASPTGSWGANPTCQSGQNSRVCLSRLCSAHSVSCLGRGGSLWLVPIRKELMARGHLPTPLPQLGRGSSCDRGSRWRISLSTTDPKLATLRYGLSSHCHAQQRAAAWGILREGHMER